MNVPSRLLRALALTALIAAGTSGCSPAPSAPPMAPVTVAPIGGEDRVGSYESPDASAVLPLADKVAGAYIQLKSVTPVAGGTATLFVSDSVAGKVEPAKLCEYTALAVNMAVRHGYGFTEDVRSTALRILKDC
ncbi:MAG: hypothetical protein ABWY04_08410 [Arthrobacter sp.]